MKIYYGKAVYGKQEIDSVIKVLKKNSLNLIDGPAVKKIEKEVSKIFGKKYGLMVNSGSSANLLGLASFNFKKNSEVITPTLTFSTTIAPIYQLNLTPHFIDVEKDMFVAKTSQIEKCINKNTVAIMIPNLLGNIADWEKISYIGKKYNLKIIEDSADTIGYSYKNNNTGKYSDIVTNSFYASHVITGAGFGGIVCFNDRHLYERAKILRGWGRSSATFNENEDIKIRFSKKINNIPYDGKYIFMEMGYNFLPSEISAAFALEQLKKLKKNIQIRVRNFNYLINFFKKYSKFFRVPVQNDKIVTPWLAFPLIIRNQKNFSRNDLQIFLEKRKIQTRVIFSGNILRQPVMKDRFYKKHKESSINSDDVMKNGILVGCHNGLNLSQLKYICDNFCKFIKIKKFN